jgi:hypothetical protein
VPFVLVYTIIPQAICHMGGNDFDCPLGKLNEGKQVQMD